MPWLTIKEFQEEFRSPPSVKTVRDWIASGHLESLQVVPGGKVWVRSPTTAANEPTTEDAMRAAIHAPKTTEARLR